MARNAHPRVREMLETVARVRHQGFAVKEKSPPLASTASQMGRQAKRSPPR
jgi:hypothetical protein